MSVQSLSRVIPRQRLGTEDWDPVLGSPGPSLPYRPAGRDRRTSPRLLRTAAGLAAQMLRLSIPLVLLVEIVGWDRPVLRGRLLVTLGGLLLVALLLRLATRALLRRRITSRLLLVGDAPSVSQALAELDLAGSSARVVGAAVSGPHAPAELEVPTVDIDSVAEAVAALDAGAVLVLPGPALPPDRLRLLAWSVEGTGAELLFPTGLTDVRASRAAVLATGRLSMLHVRRAGMNWFARVAKDTWERAAAAIALVLALPVLGLIAVAIRLESPGPAFFRQTRVGRDGRPFTMVKLRTMWSDAESRLRHLQALNEVDGGVLFKMRSDPRITRLGSFLRKYSLDEVPQLWNVVRGDMALIGPRPALPSEVESYDDIARRRLAVKPGITGLWQVSGRSDLPWSTAIRLDLHYVENWCLGLDLAIVARTVRAVVQHTGAY